MRFIAAALLVVALALPAVAQDQARPPSPVLSPGYDNRATLGPRAARGVVIWNHGGDAEPTTNENLTPFAMDALADAGFDVVRLLRPASADTIGPGVAALIRTVAFLRGRGYARVILAGQSGGAWLSFLAATQAQVDIDAIIAFAPAAYGERDRAPNWLRNATTLYEIAGRMRPVRVLLFLFAGDNYDPGGRAPELARIWGERRVPAVIVDQPAPFRGHGSGMTQGFARRFGDCIARFVRAADLAGFTCAAVEPRPLDGLTLPVVPIAANDNLPPERRRFIGRWHGLYPNGQEFGLVVHAIEGGRVDAIYTWGARGRFPGDRAGGGPRQGTIEAGGQMLVFGEPNLTRLIFVPLPDGTLTVTWTAPNGTTTMTATARWAD